jgi:hypothetical protein
VDYSDVDDSDIDYSSVARYRWITSCIPRRAFGTKDKWKAYWQSL